MAAEAPIDPKILRTQYAVGGLSPGVEAAAMKAIASVQGEWIGDSSAPGYKTFQSMLNDPDVQAAVSILQEAIISDGWTLAPKFAMPSQFEGAEDAEAVRKAEVSEEIRSAVQSWLDQSATAIQDLVLSISEGVWIGNTVAQIVLKDGSGDSAGKLVPDTLNTMPPDKLSFLIQDGRIVGFRLNGTSQEISTTLLESDLPRWKCIYWAHRPTEGRPGGRSLLRAAYEAWFMKCRVMPEFFRFLRQFASPAIIGKTPPGAAMVQAVDSNGSPRYEVGFAPGEADVVKPVLESSATALLTELVRWYSAMALALPHGTEIDLLQSEGSGEAYQHSLDYFGRQITEAILGTAQATKEAQRESRSSKDVAQDVLGVRVKLLRDGISRSIQTDLVDLLVRINFGEDKLAFSPRFTMAAVEQQDVAAMLESYSKAFATGFIFRSQLSALYERLGLPQPDWDEESERELALLQERADRAAERARILDPDGDDELGVDDD